MKPIRVALVHCNNPRFIDERMVGMWSYPVPQFDVTHYPQADKRGAVSLDYLALKHDIVWHEDHRCWVTYRTVHSGRPIPLCYFVGDSTLDDREYEARRDMALEFDAVFVDWDRLDRFQAREGGHVLRCSHSVNDKLFYDYGLPKSIDVGFYCYRKGVGYKQRIELDTRLRDFCRERGYVYDNQLRPGADYARAMNRTRLVVQVQRNPETRAHRTFDALACRACLVTDPLPDVSGEERTPGEHYVEYRSWDELAATIDRLLSTGDWVRYTNAGYELVQKHHTWARRAEQLYGQLARLFPWLKS